MEEDIFVRNNGSESGDSIQEVLTRKPASAKVGTFWKDDMVYKLIKIVEEYPCLWDARSVDNRNAVKRASTWRAISQQEFNGQIDADQLRVNVCNLVFSFLCLSFLK